MNERILELMKKAGGHMKAGEFRGFFLPPPPDYIDPETVDLKKFTRLLIEECAVAVLGFQNQFGDSAHNEIKRHFGVGE